MKNFYIVVIVGWLSFSVGNALEFPLDSQGQQISDDFIEGSEDTNTVCNCQCPQPLIVCNEGFVQLESKCYYFSTATANWDDALKSCQAKGATLAYPIDAQESTVLVNHLKTNFTGSSSWWLGGSDKAQEGQWVWAGSNAPITYSDWAKGQPDNYGSGEHCVHIYDYGSDGWKWNDMYCDYAYRYICQQ